jgi:membrane protein
VAWATLRWVVVAVGGGAYLVWLYRIAPNVKNGWRDCVPGAVLAGVGTLLITLAFRVYLELAGPAAPAVGDAGAAVVGDAGAAVVGDAGAAVVGDAGAAVVGDAGAAVVVVSQTVGAILAAVLWVWLVSCAVLIGGILNAELDHSRGIRRERKV